ncbi:hypothetical protein FBR04_09005 [Betaproteobacteria bacterium PRO7]|jgi:Rps23 Pro-64 3,4-dihydroxylase Tpa1-like proline 4-hydroxylase|nr:hypothetical protein [Betaproteobacteria bacterium PRO7]
MLNRTLEIESPKARFGAKRRVQIDAILEAPAAELVGECLTREVSWEYVYRRRGEVVTVPEQALAAMTPAERARVADEVLQGASAGFQFNYWKFSMVDAYRKGQIPSALRALLESLASAETIAMVREITGCADIRRVDAQATMYRPGNFLTAHTDQQHGEHHRRAAYVIQLSRDWQADWGGLLHFFDAQGAVLDTFVPGFNRMSLFAVPQPHAVSMVTPFAGSVRYAITGWFTA